MRSRAHRLSLDRKQRHTLHSTALTTSPTMHPILAVSRPCVNAGLTSNKRDVSACSSRHVQPIGAVASAPAALVSSPYYRLNTLLSSDCCMDRCQMIIAYMLLCEASVGHRCTARCPALDQSISNCTQLRSPSITADSQQASAPPNSLLEATPQRSGALVAACPQATARRAAAAVPGGRCTSSMG